MRQLSINCYDKMKHFFLIIIFLFAFLGVLPAQENPFLALFNKPFREYYGYITFQYFENPVVLEQLHEAAHVSGSKRWKLEAEFYEALFSYYYPLNNDPSKMESYARDAEETMPELHRLFREAEKIGATDLYLRINWHIINFYFSLIREYELGFRQILIHDRLLSGISSSDFPDKGKHYLSMERWYHTFGEYDKAKEFCLKTIAEAEILPVTLSGNTIVRHPLEAALNDLGAIYRNHYNDLTMSDSCYNRILDMKPPVTDNAKELKSFVYENTTWTYIAKGDLGHNSYLRGDYETAIPLLRYSIEKITARNRYNFSFAAGKAIVLVDIFTKQGNLLEAKNYLDSAYAYIDRSDEKDRWHDYYYALSRYHGAAGNTELTVAFMDSALAAQKQHDDAINLRNLYRAEQHAAHLELEREKFWSENYRRILAFSLAFTFIVLILSGFLLYYYRKKRAAHRELVERMHRWAFTQTAPDDLAGTGFETAPLPATNQTVRIPVESLNCHETGAKQTAGETGAKLSDNETDDEVDRVLFLHFQQLNDTEKLYCKGDITLDKVATQMCINKVYLSQAINRCTGKSFITYMNEHRIKEAIRIMSDNKTGLSLKGIGFETGFNDRKTFYTAFKKITGLSPSDFLGNLHKK